MEKEQNVIPVNLDFNAKIHNRFDIEVCDAKTGEVKQRAQAFNVICNALWTRIFTQNTYFNCIVYGSGTGTPSATDTTLFQKINAIGGSSPTYSVDDSNSPSIVISFRKSITIGTEVSNNTTIREVGIGYDDTHIVTHAMLQDMNGNPISIAKTNTDIIYIYATIYIHYTAYSQTKDVTIGNSPFDVHEYSSHIPDAKYLFSIIGGLEVFPSSGAGNVAYFGKSMLVDTTWSDYSQSSGADGEKLGAPTCDAATKTVRYSTRVLVDRENKSRGILYLGFLESIIIDVRKLFNLNNFAITGESLGSGDGSKTNFSTKFPINSAAKVYVDGVEQLSGVTISTGVDKEFYKLSQYYNPSKHLTFIPSKRLTYASGWLSTSANFVVKNDENITFTGVYVSPYSCMSHIYGSNDFNSWTELSITWNSSTNIGTFSESTNYAFYKFAVAGGRDVVLSGLYLISPNDKTYDVIFDTPPASGSVITIDYIPDCIPKDSNHVFDLTLSITLGEYSGN